MEADDSDDEPYPGQAGFVSAHTGKVSSGFMEDDEEDDEEDNVRVVQQKKGRKASDLKRKKDDEDDDDEDEQALNELRKATKEPAGKRAPAAKDDEEDEEQAEDSAHQSGGSSSYRLWCKHAHKLFKVVDAAVVRESRHAVQLTNNEHYGQLVSSNAESLWKHISFHADHVNVLTYRVGSGQKSVKNFAWCLKFTVKNETPEQEKKNKRLLVPIPYSEVQKALDRFTMSEQLRESTLVTKYAPKEKKAISPSALKWPKLVHEMSEVTTAVLPKREARSAQPSATQEDEDPSTPPPTKKKKHGAAATTDDFPPPPKKKKTTDAAAVAEEDAEPPIQYSAAPAEDRRRFLQGTSAVEPAPAPEAAPSAAQTNGTSAYKMCSMTEVREVDVVSGAPNSELDFGVFKAPSWAKKATLTVEYLP